MCKYQCIALSFLLTIVVTLEASHVGRRCEGRGYTLTCSNLKGRFLPDQNVETINNLYIITSDLSEIRNEDFFAFQDLASLHMTSCFSIPLLELSFASLSNLRELKISHCNVSEEIGMVFTNNRYITDLNLAGNKISVIKNNFLRHLYELESLDLSNNTISIIEDNVFYGLDSLKSINLAQNNLEVIQNSFLSHLQQLETLDLSQNMISVLEDDTFMGLDSLKSINLAQNNLKVIKKSCLNNLHQLETLDLRQNMIYVLEDQVFKELDSLTSINLAQNSLTEINEGYFLHLKKLQRIDVSGNQIESTNVGAFEGLNSLHMLNLSGNKIGANFNPSFLYLYFPTKCAVCKPQEDQAMCSKSYSHHCENNLSIDELWRKFLTKELYLQNNPICEIIVNKTVYTKVGDASSQQEVELDQCKFFDYGKCFRHESRRYFLLDSCGFMNSNNLVTDHYNSTVSRSILPTKNLGAQYSVESSTTGDLHGIHNTDLSVGSTEYTPDNDVLRAQQDTSQSSTHNPEDIFKNAGFEMDLSIIKYLIVALVALLTSGLCICGCIRKHRKTNTNDRVEGDHSSSSPEQERMLKDCTIIPMGLNTEDFQFDNQAQDINESSEIEVTPRSITGIKNGEAEYDKNSPASKGVEKLFLDSAKRGDVKCITTYLNEGIDCALRDQNGNTALHLAAQSGYLRTMQLLLRKTSTADVRNDRQETPLHVAIRGGHVEVVKHLLKFKANPEYSNLEGERPIHIAALSENPRIMRSLLRNEVDVMATNHTKDTALHIAAKEGHVETVNQLLKSHADANATNRDKNTPVHLAVMDGNFNTLKLLLKSGGNANAKNKYGNTPVHMAAWNGRLTTLKLILDKGGKVNSGNDQGQTPLMNAARKGHLENLKLLVKRGAEMEIRNKMGNNALLCASLEGHVEVIKFLLESGAYVNAQNYKKITPLHAAVEKNHEHAARLLISHGANIDAEIAKE